MTLSSVFSFLIPSRSSFALQSPSISTCCSPFLLSSSRRTTNFSFPKEANSWIQSPCRNRNLCVASGSVKNDPGAESFLRDVLSSMEAVYLNRNPTAKAILDLVGSVENDKVSYDHFAFRTFGVNGHGIDSIGRFFLDFGYKQMDELRFPAKKLRALWFSPPNYLLPRVFISELLLDQISSQSQEIVKRCTKESGDGYKHAALASTLGCLTWNKPSVSEFKELAKESEYAAWTLVNGYALNHLTISVHRLRSHLNNIHSLNHFIQQDGFKLNSEGGVLKVSPDGLLLQSSTIADLVTFHFADSIMELVPCSYIEFAERHVLPQYKHMAEEEIEENHRRDGFEVGNADKIFESTSKDQWEESP